MSNVYYRYRQYTNFFLFGFDSETSLVSLIKNNFLFTFQNLVFDWSLEIPLLHRRMEHTRQTNQNQRYVKSVFIYPCMALRLHVNMILH